MLALVTCHIFPPSIWYGKKWIPGTWLPGWQLAVFQSPRLHECGPADAHGNAQPFCMDTCIFRKKRLFCNLATRWNKILQFVPAFPIYGWLTWWCDFFPGQPLKIIRENSAKKRSSPLDFIFDTCASASSSHFFWLVKLNMCVCTLLQGQLYCQQKNMCFAVWARVDTKFLNSAHHVLSVDDWPGDATFFLWANLWNHLQVFSQKRSSPLDLIFDPCAFASWSHFFGWWRWTYVVVPLLQSHLKNHTHSINHGTFFPGVWHLDMF